MKGIKNLRCLKSIKRKNENDPFYLSEGIFNLLLKINETIGVGKYDGPQIDPSRFISFIERVNLPSNEK